MHLLDSPSLNANGIFDFQKKLTCVRLVHSHVLIIIKRRGARLDRWRCLQEHTAFRFLALRPGSSPLSHLARSLSHACRPLSSSSGWLTRIVSDFGLYCTEWKNGLFNLTFLFVKHLIHKKETAVAILNVLSLDVRLCWVCIDTTYERATG